MQADYISVFRQDIICSFLGEIVYSCICVHLECIAFVAIVGQA